MKRIISILLALMLLCAAVPAMAATTDVDASDLWLTDEKVTLSFWYPISQSSFLGNMADLNEADVFQWLEEKTNVHIEWIIPTSGTEKESFNLLFAGDKMPDLINNDNSYKYAEGAEAAVEDGYYLRLNELIDQYAPNYAALRAASPKIAKDTATDSGLLWSFSFIYMGESGKAANWGPCVRKDLLDKLGMEAPVTYDDWYNMLKAFKTELNIEYPLLISNYASAREDDWMSGYGVEQSFFQQDGKVKYGPIEDGYGEYVEMMAKWYAEGLIYTDFALQGENSDPADDLVLNDRIGAWAEYASKAGHDYYADRGATNPDFNLMGVTFPVKTAGDATHLRIMDTIVNTPSIAISADCKTPEIAVRWLDIFYNLKYTDIFNYGVREGESYVVNEDGSLSWGPIIMANTEGMTKNQARCKYTMANAFYEDYSRVMGSWNETQLASQQQWLKGSDDWEISGKITPTADESRELSTIMADITTFVREETAKMVMGTSTYTFESFREKIKSLGIEDAIAIEQAALDRYNAR